MPRWLRSLIAAAALVSLAAGAGLAERLGRWIAPPAGAAAVLAGGRGQPPAADEDAAALRVENARLRARLSDYAAVPGEGPWADPARLDLLRGPILSRSNRLGRRYVHLGVGAEAGAAPGMAALSGRSLVGIVDGILPARSLVQSVSDRECRVPAALVDIQVRPPEIVAQGVAAGTGAPGGLRLDLVEDRPGLSIAPGMVAVTSAAGTLPPGLLIGAVALAVRPGPGGEAGHWRIDLRPLRTIEQADSLLIARPGPAR